VFTAREGLTWLDPAGRTHTLAKGDFAEWVGQRAQAGKVVPKGFPRANKFGPAFS
jgi:topoisomerase-4 subunit A